MSDERSQAIRIIELLRFGKSGNIQR